MFDARSKSGTDGGAPPGIKRGATRQMSYGGERREVDREGLKARRQLSAPGLGEKGRPGMFRLPGMASNSKWGM